MMFPVLSANTHLTRSLNPSVFTLDAKRTSTHPTQIKHAPSLDLRDNRPQIFRATFGGLPFGHIRVTACLLTDRDICTSGSALSPFSRVSSYRCASTSNLDFTIRLYIRRHGIWRKRAEKVRSVLFYSETNLTSRLIL